jgi:CcmD family protein
MEGNGKILVVAAVLAVILVGIFVYLVMMDRKVKNLEKQVEEKKERKDS